MIWAISLKPAWIQLYTLNAASSNEISLLSLTYPINTSNKIKKTFVVFIICMWSTLGFDSSRVNFRLNMAWC